jgi:hypothetical protein
MQSCVRPSLRQMPVHYARLSWLLPLLLKIKFRWLLPL